MLKQTMKYELVLTENDKNEILEHCQELAKKFLGVSLYDTIDKMMFALEEDGVTEMLNTLSFIPCVKEVKFALDLDSISYEDMESYINDIAEWLDNMPEDTRSKYEFDLPYDYDAIREHFDGDEDKIRDYLVKFDKMNDWLDFILSDARLEKYGTDLRNDFCKWLTSRT